MLRYCKMSYGILGIIWVPGGINIIYIWVLNLVHNINFLGLQRYCASGNYYLTSSYTIFTSFANALV